MKIDKDTKKLLDDLECIDLDNDVAFITESIKAKFVEDVCQIMEAKGISKSELAKRLNKSKQYVSRVLNETTNFTMKSMVEISMALGCSIELKMMNRPEVLQAIEKSSRSTTAIHASAPTGRRKTAGGERSPESATHRFVPRPMSRV